MPIFGRKSAPESPANSDDWRPQRFGRGFRAIREAIVEPSWEGVRVLARLSGGQTRFTDEEGVDCTDEFAAVASAVAAAALAGDFIVDGFLTVEATQIVAGRPMADIQTPTKGQVMTQWIAGSRAVRSSLPERHLDPERPIAFVAVDLLSIDGARLLDVPLLERKRILDGALAPTELVRITPFVQAPGGSFITTWRGLGFRELAYKAVNGRYTPDLRNNDWSILPMPTK